LAIGDCVTDTRRGGGLRAGRKWFIGLAIGAVAAAAATTFLQSSALQQARDGAETRAKAYVPHVIEPIFGKDKPNGPIDGQVKADLTTQLDAAILGVDEVVERVRVWSPSGELWYSTDDADEVGETKSGNPAAIKSTTKGDANALATLTSGPEPRLTIFAPLRVAGPPSASVEIDDNFAALQARAKKPWTTARTGAIALAALFGLLSLLSLAATGRPAGRAMPVRAFLGEDGPSAESKTKEQPSKQEEAAAAPSNREWERMQSKLDKAEAGRKALEVELEQLRLQISNGHDQSSVRVRELEEQLEAATTRMREITAFTPASEHQDRIRDLEQQLSEATTRAKSLEAKALDLTSNVAHSESMAQRLQFEAEEARRELATVASRIAAAETRASEAELKATEAETAKGDIKAKLDALQEELRWSQAQQTETQPILQEASGRLQEAKSRADEAIARATKMEERALDAEAAATKLEERVARAEERAAAAEARAAEPADQAPGERVAELERLLEDSVKKGEELAERASELELRLKGSSDATVKAIANADAVASELAQAKATLAELQSNASGADTRADELSAKLEAAEGSVRELTQEAERLRAARAEVEQELADTRARLEAVPAEAEVAQVRVAAPGEKDGPSPELDSLRGEIERLTGELARTIESAHTAEEKSARLEAEMVAMRKAAANGDEPSSGNESAEDVPAPAPRARKKPVEEKPKPAAEKPAEEAWEAEEEPSLRSRLARASARKKGRARTPEDDALRQS
jgi:chromosome segregation ATPase